MSQGEWARRLVSVLELERALPPEPQPSDLSGLLCPDQAEIRIGAGRRSLPAGESFSAVAHPGAPSRPQRPVRVVLRVPVTALYQLTVTGAGRQRWLIDGHPVGHLDLSVLGAAQAGGVVPLRAGPHEVSGYLAGRARVDRVELAAHHTLCIAPADGWHASRALRYGAFARTLVRSFDLDRRLPVIAEETFRVEGEHFDGASEIVAGVPSGLGGGGSAGVPSGLGSPASGGGWAEAASSPEEFTWSIWLDEPRVVTLRARTRGTPEQFWSIDGRYRATLQPDAFPGLFTWNRVFTLPLSAGRHVVRARVAPGTAIDLVEMVPHRSTDADYARVLMGLGFRGDVPATPMTRARVRAELTGASFGRLTQGFWRKLAGDRRDHPLVLVDLEPQRATSGPLAPLLPGEF
ncbi:MAG: hypothetical protein GY772_01610 [bacterium]|nr:hypothetical protein [Deltaproteobacteria bacterium]MCP4239233.1 hypothetical protein [bacterium]MDP6075906.1 hypothetical protein [Myxococcota bacterium]MDP6242328.1 hypothetical protein [Myxococcota bacterium]MDP7298036.1 hypothetical protein [Myxococcota bacterium]